jgi:hypothetical protein
MNTPNIPNTPKLNPYRHFYLYAKHYYQEGDVWADLQAILSEYTGIEPQYVHRRDILEVLLEATMPHLVGPGNDQSRFCKLRGFLVHLHPASAWKINLKETDNYETRLVGWCLSTLRLTIVFKDGEDILRLGKADPNVLPLKQTEKSPEMTCATA